MIPGINILIASLAALWLTACGSGGGAQEEAGADASGSASNTDATSQSPAPQASQTAGSVSKGESTQVEVKTDNPDNPSLTLSRLGNSKLTWNEVVKAGASYLVFERKDKGEYDFTQPIQSLDDVVTLTLAEKTGTHCYIIRAKTKDNKITVDSNEICINRAEPFINLTLNADATALGEESISIKVEANSNVQGTISLSLKQTSGPTVSLEGSAGNWSFLSPNFRTPTELGFEATASLGDLTRKQTLTLTVLPKDHAPTIQSFADQSVVATELLTVATLAADADQDALSFACILNCPSGLAIDGTSGVISWRPGLDQIGEAQPVIQVSSNGRAATAALRVVVNAPAMNIVQPLLLATSGETVQLQPAIQSNLTAPYQWTLTQIGGPNVQVSGQDGQWTFAAPSVEDRVTLSFDLKVGNGLYLAQQNFSVQVDPLPIAPTVNAGSDIITRSLITATGAVSTNARTFAWKALSGPGLISFSAPNAVSTNIMADTDGVYEIELAATNSTGQTGRASFRLTWDTSAPQIEAGADASTAQALTRNAEVQGAKTIKWTKIQGPGQLLFTPDNAALTTISADQDGEYIIQVSAEDEAGNSAADSFTWFYDRTPPAVTLGDSILMQSKTKALTASVSDDAVSIQWKKVSGPLTVSFAPDNQRSTTVTLGGDGVYVVEVTASDALGNQASAQQQITVDTLPPQIVSVTPGAVLADGYLNPIEKSKAQPLVDSVNIKDSSAHTLAYKVVTSRAACTSSLIYSTNMPRSNDAAIGSAGTYKVCVKATDSMNLNAYAAGPNFIYDTTVVSAKATGLPANPSRTTNLQAVVSGSYVTHYKSKVGAAENTDCASSADYGVEAPVTAPILFNYADYADGLLRLCVIGRTAGGNWQDLSVAFRYDWTLDRAMPGAPMSLTASPLVARTRLSWPAASAADAYLIIRTQENSVTWTPTSGQAYVIGGDIDGGKHQVVGLTSDLYAFDETAIGDRTYNYAVFALDRALNYNPNPAETSGTAVAPIEFSKADGFDRLVRVVRPILDGEHKGKILVGGDFLVYRKDPAVRLLRLNSDFTLDTSFKPAVINSSVYSIALADDGSIYIGGTFTNVGGKVRNRVARLTSTGALDEGFVPPGFNSTVMTLALSPDQNRIYVGGAFTALTTTPATAMNRLAALRTYDGALDTAFQLKTNTEQTVTGFNSTVWTILPEPTTSHIFVGGQFTNYGGVSQARLIKLDETGEIDGSLNLGSGFDNTVVILKADSHQRLYVGGSFGRYRGSSYYARLVRLKADGAPDTDFNKGQSTSPRLNSTVYALELDETNQKVYVGGDFTLYGTSALTRLARLSMLDGSLDSTMTGGTNGTLQALALTDSGKLIGGGNFQRYAGESTAFFFAASGTSGALDAESPRGSNLNNVVYANARMIENVASPRESLKYFVAGSFTTYNGEIANRIVKLDRLGNMDKSFTAPVINSNVYAIAWDDQDKKLYIGGTFTMVNGVVRNRIARLNADGTHDTSFVPDGFDSDVYAIALARLPNNGARVVYVGGKFTKNGSAAAGRLVRLGTDGKVDTNFATGTGFDNNVAALMVVPGNDDHAVFVGGSFTKYNTGFNAPRLVKLASDGTMAAGFEPGAGFNGSVQALTWVPAEEALYVGGAFSRYQTSIVANRIAKLDSTGAMAAGFNATGFNSTVFALDYDADNDLIWAGGAFTSFRGVTQGRMAAMGRDGSRVAAFNAPVGFNSDVRAISASYWGVVAGGLGSSYEGDISGFLARLHVNASMD
jgi:hypothetical protein